MCCLLRLPVTRSDMSSLALGPAQPMLPLHRWYGHAVTDTALAQEHWFYKSTEKLQADTGFRTQTHGCYYADVVKWMLSCADCDTHGCCYASIVKFTHVPNVSQGLCSTPGRSTFYSKDILIHACWNQPQHASQETASCERRHVS